MMQSTTLPATWDVYNLLLRRWETKVDERLGVFMYGFNPEMTAMLLEEGLPTNPRDIYVVIDHHNRMAATTTTWLQVLQMADKYRELVHET